MYYKNRAVITGLGIVAPNGIGKEAYWQSLLQCHSGIGPITLFDASNLKSRFAGEVKNFNPKIYMDLKIKTNRAARHTLLALVATQLAIEDAKLDLKQVTNTEPLPIVLGASTSAFDIIEHGVN